MMHFVGNVFYGWNMVFSSYCTGLLIHGKLFVVFVSLAIFVDDVCM